MSLTAFLYLKDFSDEIFDVILKNIIFGYCVIKCIIIWKIFINSVNQYFQTTNARCDKIMDG